MPQGIIKRLVHRGNQSSLTKNSDNVVGHNWIGYGYIEDGGELLYFEPKALADVEFDSLRTGQHVEYTRDNEFAMATKVSLSKSAG